MFLEELYNQIGEREYELADGYVISRCYDNFPNVYFLFEDKWLEVDPADYIVDISDNQDRSLCVLLFSESDQPFIVMGLPIYMNYYTVHDDSNNRIGFVPHLTSTKPFITLAEDGPKESFGSLDPALEPTHISA